MSKLSAKKSILIVAGCSAAIFSLILLFLSRTTRQKPAVYPIPRHIQYGFTLQNQTDGLIPEAQFWTYAPVRMNATQKCQKIWASYPYKLTVDNAGNQVLHFVFSNIAPHGAIVVDIGADLQLTDKPNLLPGGSLDAFLKKERFVETTDPDLIKLAKKLKAGSAARTAKNIFRWVAGNIRYTGYDPVDHGALYALRRRAGDCTEFMYLLVALCRIDRIPARGVSGYICPTDAVLNPAGFHNWAEVYFNGAWHIADAQRKVFMKDSSQYVAMHEISDPAGRVKNQTDEFHKFGYSGEGLKVWMNR